MATSISLSLILLCFRVLIVVAVVAVATTTTLKVVQHVHGCLYYAPEVCDLRLISQHIL